VLALEAAPAELAGFAGALTVLLPWGSLLTAVATGDVSRLAALCRPAATVRIVFGYGPIDATGLPALESVDELLERYAAAGMAMTARRLDLDEVRALGTTWAKKLAFAPAARRFVELTNVKNP
jgi:hypothetical protein